MGTKKYIFRFSKEIKLWEIGDYDSPVLFKTIMGIQMIHYLLALADPWNITMPPFMRDGTGLASLASRHVQDQDPNYVFDNIVEAWTLYNMFSHYTKSHKYNSTNETPLSPNRDFKTVVDQTDQEMAIYCKQKRCRTPRQHRKAVNDWIIDQLSRRGFKTKVGRKRAEQLVDWQKHGQKEYNYLTDKNGNELEYDPQLKRIVDTVSKNIINARQAILIACPDASPLISNIRTGEFLYIPLYMNGINKSEIQLY